MSEENPPGPQENPERTPAAPPWWRRRVVLAAGVVVVLAAGGLVAVRALGGPGALPAPRTLAHDPVPAGPIVWVAPADCGVSGKTVDALVPRAQLDLAGDDGTCEWSSRGTDTRGGRRLTVDLSIVHAGSGPVNSIGGFDDSPIGGAIARYRAASIGGDPVAGLGDEADLGGAGPGPDGTRAVTFRTGNLVATVRYQADRRTGSYEPDRTWTAGLVRDGLFRAAADTARSVGAPAAPRTVVPPARPAPAVFPKRICAAVPKALRDSLVGDDAESGDGGEPSAPAAAITAPRTASCSWHTDSRVLTATITTSDAKAPGVAARDVAREYLRRYYEARDEPPVSARDPRYFHPLKGLGDLAFCAYLAESTPPGTEAHSPARVVVRVGVTLVTVTYGSVPDPYDKDTEASLTRQEAVNGAYAAAGQVVRSLHG